MIKLIPKNKKGNWIKGAVNPKHKGYCTPMTKSTCTPRRKAFARTMKKHHGFHKEEGGEVEMTTTGGKGPRKVIVEKQGGLILLGQNGLSTGMPSFIKAAVEKYNSPDVKKQREFDQANERAKNISGRTDLAPVQPEDFLGLGLLAGAKILPKVVPNLAKRLVSLGGREVAPQTKKLFHYSANPNLSLDDVEIFRPGVSQLKRKYADLSFENKPGGFYTTKNPSDSFMGGKVGYEMNIPTDAKVLDLKKLGRTTDRIPIKELHGYRKEGYDLVKGKNMVGQDEWIPLNKSKLSGWNKFTEDRRGPLLKNGGKLSKDYIEKAREKPGGSNVGKEKFASGAKRTGPYAGPSGGAPKGSYPIPDIGHAKAAIKLSGHAPNPAGIKSAVYRKYPELKK